MQFRSACMGLLVILGKAAVVDFLLLLLQFFGDDE